MTAAAAASAAPPRDAATVDEPRRIELVEGKRVDVSNDVTVILRSVLYAHVSGSRNSSLLTMEVTRGARHEQVTLDRLDPVGPEGPKYRLVLGLRVAIDYVDPYHQPSTGAILVRPE